MINITSKHDVIVFVNFMMLISIAINTTFACETGQIKLQILGSGGPELNDNRASTSYLIWVDNKARILIDTGSGSNLNFEKSGAKIEELDAILFTHFHVDHSAAFPSYIKASYFTKRDRDLFVFGPDGNKLMPSTSEFVEKTLSNVGTYRYLNNYIDKESPSNFKVIPNNVVMNKEVHSFKIKNDISVSAIRVHHGSLAAVAWRVDIYECTITFSGDMSNYFETLEVLAKNSNILVAHNSVPEGLGKAAYVLHMPPSEIGRIASAAKVSRLILSHRMNRTLGKEEGTLNAIKRHYTGPVTFANDLDIYELN